MEDMQVIEETKEILEKKQVVRAIPRPVLDLFVEDLTVDETVLKRRKQVENIMDKLSKKENMTDAERTVWIDKYRVGAITFESLFENNTLGYTEPQKRELASALLSGYLSISETFWPGSRTQNCDYVVIDTETDADTAQAKAEHFCRNIAPDIISGFNQKTMGTELEKVNLADYLVISIGRKIDTNVDGETNSALPIRFSVSEEGDLVDVSQNFKATPDTIFAPVVLHAKGIKERLAEVQSATEEIVLPILKPSKENPEFEGKIKSKGVNFGADFARASSSEYVPIKSEPNLTGEKLDWITNHMASESYFTPAKILELVRDAKMEHKLGKEYMSLLVDSAAQQLKMSPDTSETKQMLSVDLGEAETSAVDLSGMSKISSLIGLGEYDRTKYSEARLFDGFQSFMSNWQDRVAQELSKDGFFSDERGGDGLKGIRVKTKSEDDTTNLSDRVGMALRLSGLWSKMTTEITLGLTETTEEIKEFVAFLSEMEQNESLSGILMKAAVVQTETNLDIHAAGFVELRSSDKIDLFLSGAKHYLQRSGSLEPVVAANKVVAEQLMTDTRYKVRAMSELYPGDEQYASVYLVKENIV